MNFCIFLIVFLQIDDLFSKHNKPNILGQVLFCYTP